MSSSHKIIGVGSPIIDAIAPVEDAFLDRISGAKGGMELVDAQTLSQLIDALPVDPSYIPGGSAANTLFALARMGVATSFIGKIGNDEHGTFYKKCFNDIGGETHLFKVGDLPSGRCLSLVTPDGERTMRTHLGAAMTLSPKEISADDFIGCTHAHIEGYLLFHHELLFRVLESARQAKCSISLDLASFEIVRSNAAILADILRDYVDIVFANEEEAAAFTGIEKDYRAMTEALARLCKIAAVKMGAQGAYIAYDQKVHFSQAIPTENAIDSTGAGDLWAAGFLYGWSQQHPIDTCAHFGARLGSAVVKQQGAALPENTWKTLIREIQAQEKPEYTEVTRSSSI